MRLAPLLALLLLTGCGHTVVGRWQVQPTVFQPAPGGEYDTLNLHEDGTYEGGPGDGRAGTYVVSDDRITFDDGVNRRTYGLKLHGNGLILDEGKARQWRFVRVAHRQPDSVTVPRPGQERRERVR